MLNLPVLAFALIQAIRWLQSSRDPEPELDIAAMLLLLPLPTDREPERWCSRVWCWPACAGLAWTGVAAQKLSLVWLIPGLLVFGVSRPAIFTPASVGPFIAVPGEHRAFAASLVTEARQLGAVLGVAAMGLAYTVDGSTRLDADARVLADGFEAAMLTAAAVVAVAAIVIAKRMPNVTADE